MNRTTPRIARKPTRTERAPQPPTAARKHRRPADVQLVGFPLQRVFDIHTWINDGRIITIPYLQKKWKVSRSTVKRDIQFMRTRLEMPIEWNDDRKTFLYTRPFPTLPFLILTREEALVIALAARVLAPMWGPSFARRFKDIVTKIAPVLGSAVSRALRAAEHVHGPAAAAERDDFALIMPLLEAIESRRAVGFQYTRPGGKGPRPRTVHPLDLNHVDNILRLIAYLPGRGKVCDFLLPRIADLQVRDDLFERPADYNARERVENCAGSHSGGEVQDIRLALDARAADCARERVWHHSQRLTRRSDGRTEMTLRLGDLPGIRNRVLSWGSLVEVLAPATLRDEVRKTHRAALERYDHPTPLLRDVAPLRGQDGPTA